MEGFMGTLIAWLMIISMFGAWPTAAYLSARRIRGRSQAESVRFALVIGLAFIFASIIASDFVLPLREGRRYIDFLFPLAWMITPFLLIGIQSAIQRPRKTTVSGKGE